MTAHYEFTGARISDVLPDVRRITEQAVEDGRAYSVQYASNLDSGCVLAAVTVYTKQEQTDA